MKNVPSKSEVDEAMLDTATAMSMVGHCQRVPSDLMQHYSIIAPPYRQ